MVGRSLSRRWERWHIGGSAGAEGRVIGRGVVGWTREQHLGVRRPCN